MKKTIKQTKKSAASPEHKKGTRPFTAKRSGYKEEIYNKEQQGTYEKSDIAKDNKKNTPGPKS